MFGPLYFLGKLYPVEAQMIVNKLRNAVSGFEGIRIFGIRDELYHMLTCYVSTMDEIVDAVISTTANFSNGELVMLVMIVVFIFASVMRCCKTLDRKSFSN